MEIQTRVALTEIWLGDDLEVFAAALPVPRVRVLADDRGALRARASLVTVDVSDRTHLLELFLSVRNVMKMAPFLGVNWHEPTRMRWENHQVRKTRLKNYVRVQRFQVCVQAEYNKSAAEGWVWALLRVLSAAVEPTKRKHKLSRLKHSWKFRPRTATSSRLRGGTCRWP